jgi:hypothetical protein
MMAVGGMKTLLCSALLACAIGGGWVHAQQAQKPAPSQQKKAVLLPRPKARLPRQSIAVSGGLTIPLSHHDLTDFWTMGPGGSLTFFAHVHRLVSLGIGAEGSILKFRPGAFAQTFPNVPVEARSIGLLHVYLTWRYTFVSQPPVSPFIGASVGAAKATAVGYQTMIDGIRKVYYEIPGRMHLAVAGLVGADFFLNNRLAIEVEGKGVYLYNDPEVGLFLSVRAGVRAYFY